MDESLYQKHFKRFLDFILSLVTLIILSPLLIVVAFLIKTKLGSPVFFVQERPGLNGEIFKMYKFRTMTDEMDDQGNLLPDSERLTNFGKFLRSTSLDEFPELINIIKGDMSIVGPRPQLVRDSVFMTDKEKTRHSVLPGLTGLAQVNGRNAISWPDKFEFDLIYIENITFYNDFKIIIKTIQKVFMREDIAAEGMATAEDYGDYLLSSGLIDKKTYNKKINEAILKIEEFNNDR